MNYGSAPNSSQYLESRVRTASSADLQLMLLDGALRFAKKAQTLWDDQTQYGEVYAAMLRTLDIIEAIVTGVAESTDPVAEQLEEQYAFLYRELAAAQMNYDRARLDRAIELLAFERETWRLGCEKAKGAAPSSTVESVPAEPSPPAVPPRRRPLAAPIDATLPTGGFSVQA